MNYIDPDDLVVYYDQTRVLQLVTDGATDAVLADLSNAASAPYAIAFQAIVDASSDIDQHCQQGKRYTRADLEAIVAAAEATPSDEILAKRASGVRRLTADLAFYYLMSRRGFTADKMRSIAPRADAALEALAQLATGVRILDIDANIAASIPIRVRIGSQLVNLSQDNRMFGVFRGDGQAGSLWNC